MNEKPLSPDAQYVVDTLFPELRDNFRQWSQEYQQERDLGALGEFVGMYRKARKLKTVFHDKVDPSNWRESVRTIALEVAAHALLLVRDLDKEGTTCPRECSEMHTFEAGCLLAPKPEAPQYMTVADGNRPKGVMLNTIIFVSDLKRFERRVPGGWEVTCAPRCLINGHREGDPLCVAIGKPRG